MTVMPYSWYVPATVTVPAAGARTGVPCWERMSRPLWNSVPCAHGDCRMPNSELTAPRTGQRDDATIEGVDRRLLLGELLFEGASLYRELPELHPVPEERAECRDRHRDAGERGESRGPGEVEADNAGAVAANDEQAELLAAGPATSAPWVCRRRVSGVRYRPRYRPGQAVSRRCLVTHEAKERARDMPEDLP